MASPQIENGHTRIANELLEALAFADFSGEEARLIFALLRKTYGYQKKLDFISNSQFVKATGLYKAHVSRGEARLVARKIVTRIGNRVGLNKNYDDWLKKDIVTRIGNRVTRIGNNLLPELVDTKESKETIQKKLPDKSGLSKIKSKKTMKTYNEDKHYEEQAIDIETGEPLSPQKKKEPRKPNLMLELMAWAEKRKGSKFVNFGKQAKYIAMMTDSGKTHDEIADRWEIMEKDPFWSKAGFDFKNVADNFDKKI